MTPEYDPGASYDSVRYSSYPCTKSHPRSMAVLAALFGMTPPSIRSCRVLEIGCGEGGNLLPMAIGNPNSQFLGIDASANQIATGQERAARLDLSNVELRQQNILDFANEGEFDYIICHGVYSWVPRRVQDKILAVCRDHLASNGVAYVSYNTYPGWYLRRGVREMMRYHAKGFNVDQEKIDQSRALLDFLIDAVNMGGDAYEMLLDEELKVIRECEDGYLFHEHLEDCNEPIFFNEFIERAEQSELRFLGEAYFSTMMPNDFSEDVQDTLHEIAPDIIRCEQYLDFLRNRKFRQTLLTHHDTELSRTVDPKCLRPFYISSSLAPLDVDDAEDVELEAGTDPSDCFVHPTGRRVTVTSPFIKLAIKHLSDSWPAEIAFEELAQTAWRQTPIEQRADGDDWDARLEELSSTLLECYSSDVVEVFAEPCHVTATVSDTPTASPLSRYQASRGSFVTNERHETARLNSFDRMLIQQLDGEKRQLELVDGMLEEVENKNITIEGNPSPRREDVENAVRLCLAQLARAAILIG